VAPDITPRLPTGSLFFPPTNFPEPFEECVDILGVDADKRIVIKIRRALSDNEATFWVEVNRCGRLFVQDHGLVGPVEIVRRIILRRGRRWCVVWLLRVTRWITCWLTRWDMFITRWDMLASRGVTRWELADTLGTLGFGIVEFEPTIRTAEPLRATARSRTRHEWLATLLAGSGIRRIGGGLDERKLGGDIKHWRRPRSRVRARGLRRSDYWEIADGLRLRRETDTQEPRAFNLPLRLRTGRQFFWTANQRGRFPDCPRNFELKLLAQIPAHRPVRNARNPHEIGLTCNWLFGLANRRL
jgi:hypothetical protein